MPYTYTLTSVIPATPEEIYEAWLDSLSHSAMTGSAASTSDEVGAEVSVWNGYITGRNIELVPGERIVQSWRTDKFSDEHEDSTITLTFEEMDDGTLLTLVHANVPEDQRNYEEGGWESNYFEPMRAYFANLREAADESDTAAEPTLPPRRALAKTAKRPAARAKPLGGAKKETAKKTTKKAAKKKPRAVARGKSKSIKRAAARPAKRAGAKKKQAPRKRARR